MEKDPHPLRYYMKDLLKLYIFCSYSSALLSISFVGRKSSQGDTDTIDRPERAGSRIESDEMENGGQRKLCVTERRSQPATAAVSLIDFSWCNNGTCNIPYIIHIHGRSRFIRTYWIFRGFFAFSIPCRLT